MSEENDNLRDEYVELFQDVEQEIPWVRIALERKPEAINLWIGNSRSTTALHRDHYENIYCQVMGKKHFVLLSPVETACINEVGLQPATYAVDFHPGCALQLGLIRKPGVAQNAR